MNKRFFILAMAAVVATLFVAAGIYAGTEVPDVIKMESKAYKHKKGIVEFTHKKHTAEYGAKCGECHHDDKGKPLTELKEGDDVQKCIECHSKPGEKPKGKDAPRLSDKEAREYHAEALHDNCKGCHREHNKKNKTRAAPTTCSKCHPKN
jgi:cytochrome c553